MSLGIELKDGTSEGMSLGPEEGSELGAIDRVGPALGSSVNGSSTSGRPKEGSSDGTSLGASLKSETGVLKLKIGLATNPPVGG